MKKRIISIIGLFLVVQICYGQTNNGFLDRQRNKESFLNLTDTILINEISFFNIKGATLKNTDSLQNTILDEIPIRYCTDKYVSFEKKSTYIRIYSSIFDSSKHKLSYDDNMESRLKLIDNKPFWGKSNEIPHRKVDSIEVITHSHFMIKLPDSAFIGIYEPNICKLIRVSKHKKEEFTSPYYGAFQSEDKRFIYIYMLLGSGTESFEVTFVIKDNKYHKRVLDYVL